MILASQVDRLNKVSLRTKQIFSAMGRIPVRERSRKVILASQVDRLNNVSLASHVYCLDNVNCRNKRAISNKGGSIPARGIVPVK